MNDSLAMFDSNPPTTDILSSSNGSECLNCGKLLSPGNQLIAKMVVAQHVPLITLEYGCRSVLIYDVSVINAKQFANILIIVFGMFFAYSLGVNGLLGYACCRYTHIHSRNPSISNLSLSLSLSLLNFLKL